VGAHIDGQSIGNEHFTALRPMAVLTLPAVAPKLARSSEIVFGRCDCRRARRFDSKEDRCLLSNLPSSTSA
jgi:hypothetical protein